MYALRHLWRSQNSSVAPLRAFLLGFFQNTRCFMRTFEMSVNVRPASCHSTIVRIVARSSSSGTIRLLPVGPVIFQPGLTRWLVGRPCWRA